jgi:hypothetical protein
MDSNFFEPLDKYEEKLDSSYSDCVQIQNLSGSILQAAGGFYMRNYSFGLVSKNNKNIEKFLQQRKIKVYEFSVVKPTKKKKIKEQQKVEMPPAEKPSQSIDIHNLTALFNKEESNKNQDEI